MEPQSAPQFLRTYGRKRLRPDDHGASAAIPEQRERSTVETIDGETPITRKTGASTEAARSVRKDAFCADDGVGTWDSAAQTSSDTGLDVHAEIYSPLQTVADELWHKAADARAEVPAATEFGASIRQSCMPADGSPTVADVAPANSASITPLPASCPIGRGGTITSFFGMPTGLLSAVGKSNRSSFGTSGKAGLHGHQRPSVGGRDDNDARHEIASAVTPVLAMEAARRSGLASASSPVGSEVSGPVDSEDRGSAVGQSSAPASAPAKTGQLVQLHLDIGQKAFGPTSCRACGMVYTIAHPADEEAHRKFCAVAAAAHAAKMAGAGGQGRAAAVPLIAFAGWKDEAVVFDGTLPCSPDKRTVRIVHVRPSDLSSHAGHRVKVDELDGLLVKELGPHSAPGKCRMAIKGQGGHEETQEGASSSGAAASTANYQAQAPTVPEVHRFVAVAAGTIVAAVVVEVLDPPVARRIRVAGPAVADSSCGSSAATLDEQQRPGTQQGQAAARQGRGPASGPLLLSVGTNDTLERATLGVAQVWVHPSWRRRGVAGVLLDSARTHAMYAYPVPLQELAFSQPTREGFALAAAYTGTRSFLVY